MAYEWEKWVMPTQAERISILETKMDDLKQDVRDLHDCLDKTRDVLLEKIREMGEEDTASHSRMLEQISLLEQFKTKWVYISAGAIAALGWISGHAEILSKLF